MTIFAIYRNFKNPELTPQTSETALPQTDTTESIPHYSNSNYYHREFRSKKITGAQKTDENFILDAIYSKKRSLEAQINQPKRSFWGYLWSEDSKRQAKIKYLDDLHSTLLNTNSHDNLLPLAPNSAFQSFFKAVGDVEDIAEAAQKYLQQSAR